MCDGGFKRFKCLYGPAYYANHIMSVAKQNIALCIN